MRYLKNPELFDKMGIKPPHGVLLEGAPGCGKVSNIVLPVWEFYGEVFYTKLKVYNNFADPGCKGYSR